MENHNYSQETIARNNRRLSNQIWKCIPMREENGDWQKQLETVSIEIAGLAKILSSAQLLQLHSKIVGLQTEETSFEVFRKTIFECLSLLQEIS